MIANTSEMICGKFERFSFFFLETPFFDQNGLMNPFAANPKKPFQALSSQHSLLSQSILTESKRNQEGYPMVFVLCCISL